MSKAYQRRPNDVLFLSPREENVFNGARQFMHRWSYFKNKVAPSALGSLAANVRQSAAGNLNIQGKSFAAPSVMFLPWQQGFENVVEPGIWPLVEVFTHKLNFITYTSWEGHLYGQNTPIDERHIGVVPRTDAEYEVILNLFIDACRAWGTPRYMSAIQPGIMENRLIDGDTVLPSLDFYLSCKNEDLSAEYFQQIDGATEFYAKHFNEIDPPNFHESTLVL